MPRFVWHIITSTRGLVKYILWSIVNQRINAHFWYRLRLNIPSKMIEYKYLYPNTLLFKRIVWIICNRHSSQHNEIYQRYTVNIWIGFARSHHCPGVHLLGWAHLVSAAFLSAILWHDCQQLAFDSDSLTIMTIARARIVGGQWFGDLLPYMVK